MGTGRSIGSWSRRKSPSPKPGPGTSRPTCRVPTRRRADRAATARPRRWGSSRREPPRFPTHIPSHTCTSDTSSPTEPRPSGWRSWERTSPAAGSTGRTTSTPVVRFIASAYRDFDLATTDTSVVLRFRGDQILQAGVDGPWDFSLTLYYAPLAYARGNATPGPIGTILPPQPAYYPETLCGTTSTYRAADFDPTVELVRYTGRFQEVTPDRNGDGTFDALLIRAEVEVFATASFDLSGLLAAASGSPEIAKSFGQVCLQQGTQWAEFSFAGPNIRAAGIDGPYQATLSITPTAPVGKAAPALGASPARRPGRPRPVVAIGAARRLAAYLGESLPGVEVIEGDALPIEWPRFDIMASTLPYQISSPLTFRLLGESFRRAVLMYQWEFARRMIAKPATSDYSRLSVGVYRRAACEILERVPRNAFHPQPRVDSALVRLEPRPAPFPIGDPDRYDAVVDVLFKHRRKTVENGLRLGWKAVVESPEALETVLPTVPFRTRRVEELSPEEIGRIADAVRMAKG